MVTRSPTRSRDEDGVRVDGLLDMFLPPAGDDLFPITPAKKVGNGAITPDKKMLAALSHGAVETA